MKDHPPYKEGDVYICYVRGCRVYMKPTKAKAGEPNHYMSEHYEPPSKDSP